MVLRTLWRLLSPRFARDRLPRNDVGSIGEKDMTTNKRIIVVLVFISVLFLALIGYLTYWTLFNAQAVAENPYNLRNVADENAVLRGNIYDRNGVVLASSKINSDGTQTRNYPFGALYSGVIGYNSPIYGKSGLEKSYNNDLLGKGNILGLQPTQGNALYLTIDNNLQQIAQAQLGQRKGAVVAINPQTGEILALADYPNFDPNEIQLENSWQDLVENQDSPFLNRALNGLYQPGSTFKIITTAAILANGGGNETFKDTGSTNIDGKVFTNYHSESYGNVDLAKAFAMSSNVAFCTWGSEVGGTNLRNMAMNFGFEGSMDIGIPVTSSSFPQKSMSLADVAAASIGQWNILATPIEMARAAGIIANGGRDVNLHLVDRVVNKDGGIVQKNSDGMGKQVIDSGIASQIKDLMIGVVKSGTATNAAISGVQVAGKTGTAENAIKNKEHAWFVAFVPADNPTIAVAVCLENAGQTGSVAAVPIAREVIKAALGR